MHGGVSASRGHSRSTACLAEETLGASGASDRGTNYYSGSDVYGDSYYVGPNRSCDSGVGADQRDDSEEKPWSQQQRRRERRGSRG